MFRRRSLWREDAHLLIYRLTDRFHSALKELAKNASETEAMRATVLIKLHWALCTLAGRASAERLEDAQRLFNFIAQVTDQFNASLSELSSEEEEVVDKLLAQLEQDLPSINDVRCTSRRPIVGSLARLARNSGRFRTASALGSSQPLTQTTDRMLMDKFLATHRSILANAGSQLKKD